MFYHFYLAFHLPINQISQKVGWILLKFYTVIQGQNIKKSTLEAKN